ncbi:hypothetical protein [Streptomyces sp. NPDC058953]|uniref:hypothetical protein n=1 Tax=unclassified Streptomyces TaxID=2593676 RepID=UPI0036781DD5
MHGTRGGAGTWHRPVGVVVAIVVRPESSGAARELARLQARIEARFADHGDGYGFAGYLDATTGRIVLESVAPPDVVTAVAGRRATGTLSSAGKAGPGGAGTTAPCTSGAPFYAKDENGAHARGRVFATSGTSCYVTPWGRVASALGVTIVPG